MIDPFDKLKEFEQLRDVFNRFADVIETMPSSIEVTVNHTYESHKPKRIRIRDGADGDMIAEEF